MPACGVVRLIMEVGLGYGWLGTVLVRDRLLFSIRKLGFLILFWFLAFVFCFRSFVLIYNACLL